MGKHILLIQGHPDAGQRHLCHALEEAYPGVQARRATRSGASTWRRLIFRCCAASTNGSRASCRRIWLRRRMRSSGPGTWCCSFRCGWATCPRCSRAFLEQVARPGFAFSREAKNPLAAKGLAGRSAGAATEPGRDNQPHASSRKAWVVAPGVNSAAGGFKRQRRSVAGSRFRGSAPQTARRPRH